MKRSPEEGSTRGEEDDELGADAIARVSKGFGNYSICLTGSVCLPRAFSIARIYSASIVLLSRRAPGKLINPPLPAPVLRHGRASSAFSPALRLIILRYFPRIALKQSRPTNPARLSRCFDLYRSVDKATSFVVNPSRSGHRRRDRARVFSFHDLIHDPLSD